MSTRQFIIPEDVAAVILLSRVNRQMIGEIIRVTGGRQNANLPLIVHITPFKALESP